MRPLHNDIINLTRPALVTMMSTVFALGIFGIVGADDSGDAGIMSLNTEVISDSEQSMVVNTSSLSECRGRDKDADYDGFTDEEERRVGTNPRDTNSHPTLADNHEKIMAYWPLMSDAVEALEGELNGELLHGARFKHGALELDGRRAYVNFGAAPALSFWGGFPIACGSSRKKSMILRGCWEKYGAGQRRANTDCSSVAGAESGVCCHPTAAWTGTRSSCRARFGRWSGRTNGCTWV